MSDLAEKKLIRKEILCRRDNMTGTEVLQKSKEISERLFSLDCYKSAKVIFSYISNRNEVDTKSINMRVLKDGKKLAVPRVNGDLMDFYFINGYEDLEDGYFGISEPKIYTKKADADECELMLVPGVVFDKNFHRIGYGKGFYDKYIDKRDNSFVKIGLAYDFQILDKIPCDRFDISMDMIIMNS